MVICFVNTAHLTCCGEVQGTNLYLPHPLFRLCRLPPLGSPPMLLFFSPFVLHPFLSFKYYVVFLSSNVLLPPSSTYLFHHIFFIVTPFPCLCRKGAMKLFKTLVQESFPPPPSSSFFFLDLIPPFFLDSAFSTIFEQFF